MKPKIYTMNCSNALGFLSSGTEKNKQPKCPLCNRVINEHIRYSNIELNLEVYNGEDMFCPERALIITESFYNKLLANNIRGFAPIKVNVIKSKYYDGLNELPKFYNIGILNSKVNNIPIAYDYDDKLCANCGGYILNYNEEKMKNMLREKEQDEIHLQVFSDSWHNEDIFNFSFHPEIGITQNFLKIMRDFNCPKTTVIPAEWI